jgi:hypothetical protein
MTKKDSRERFAELLGPDSKNFLGTGLTMQEFMQLDRAEKLSAAWCIQSREERKRRLHAVMQLSVELARIKEVTVFSSRLAEQAIEAVIEGDWKTVQEYADLFSFNDEREELRERCVGTFATFRELLLQALRAAKEMPA